MKKSWLPQLNPRAQGEHIAIQLLWATAPLLDEVFFIFSFLVLLKDEYVGPVQDFILLFRVNQENLGAGESKIPLCDPSGRKLLLRPSSSYNKLMGWVAFRILSKIHNGALLQKQSTVLACWLFLQKNSNADVWLDFKCAFDWRCCKCEVSVDCKCMEFVATGCCTGKKLRLDQTTSTSGLKKTRFVYLLDLLGGRGRRSSVIYCVWSTFRWFNYSSWSYSG